MLLHTFVDSIIPVAGYFRRSIWEVEFLFFTIVLWIGTLLIKYHKREENLWKNYVLSNGCFITFLTVLWIACGSNKNASTLSEIQKSTIKKWHGTLLSHFMKKLDRDKTQQYGGVKRSLDRWKMSGNIYSTRNKWKFWNLFRLWGYQSSRKQTRFYCCSTTGKIFKNTLIYTISFDKDERLAGIFYRWRKREDYKNYGERKGIYPGSRSGRFWITDTKAKRIIETADCIIYDRLINPKILGLVKRKRKKFISEKKIRREEEFKKKSTET